MSTRSIYAGRQMWVRGRRARISSSAFQFPIGTINRVEVSDALMDGWDIATRPGAHCAPLMHQALGTVEQGIVRLSTSWFTTPEEVDVAVGAIREIAEG